MKKNIYLLLLILLPLTLAATAKTGFIEQLLRYLKVYNEVYPEEKAYVQTDKTYYEPNEAIWYKAFLLNSNDSKPSYISDVLYVELRDPKGNVVAQHEHNVKEGAANGEFTLGENQTGGIYTLAAYTSWIKNRGDELVFKKEITVQKVITPRLLLKLDFEKRAYGPGDEVVALLTVANLRNEKTTGSDVTSTVKIAGATVQTLNNKTDNGEAKIRFKLPENLNTADGILQILVGNRGIEESIIRSIPIVLDKVKLQFFPEGGYMVQNVTGKVAFEALNEFGKGADVSGTIVDENGAIITTFESYHLGMGAFQFTPQVGKTYFAKIEKPLGNNEPVALPRVMAAGYMLNLKSKEEQHVEWSVYSPSDATVTLVGQSQSEVYHAEAVKLNKGMNSVSVKTDKFPIGIAVFTLFDELNKEVCERLVFLNDDKGLHIKIEPDKQQYKPAEEVKLAIKTTDKNGKPVSANLGLSVVDEQLLTLADDKQDNMLSYLLFSSELKGKIQEPYFYFDETQLKAKEAIDYLMLTHGWRRFEWSEVYRPTRVYTENAERVSSIFGFITDRNGNPAQGNVYLIERGSRKKLGKLRTTPQGYFVFHNVDLSRSVYVVTLAPNVISLFNGSPQVDVKERYAQLLKEHENKASIEKATRQPDIPETAAKAENELRLYAEEVLEAVPYEQEVYSYYELSEDAELSEVVITGYGTQKRSDITAASSMTITPQDIMNPSSVAYAIAGKVSGLMVQSVSVAPGSSPNLSIRGTSTFSSGNNEYMLVIDGILLSNPISANQSLLDFVNVNSIKTLTITKALPMQYIGRAVNGTIYIETKLPSFNKRSNQSYKYTGQTVDERSYYTPSVYTQSGVNPDMLNSTVYWNGKVKTDSKGEAAITFKNNDASSSYRITVEGFSPEQGLIGSSKYNISTQKPFSIDAKLPLFAGYSDTVRIPVMLRNNTEAPMQAYAKIVLPSAITPVGNESSSVTIAAQSSQVVYFSFVPKNYVGEHQVTIQAKTDDNSDEISRPVSVRSVFFPVAYSFSGRRQYKAEDFVISGNVKGSIKGEIVCYTNIMDELFDGMESIFRSPYGCFEQVSSSTFPNIFALQLLEATGQADERVRTLALKYLEDGYAKLAAYEVIGTGGFEWYGGTPAHEVLSAYGLVEFYEMSKVYRNVDKQMMDRTRDFILSRKTGLGGFKQNRGRYGFSAAPENVNNAYIVYALTETGYTTDINREYQYSLSEAQSSMDMYRMALMANAAYNMKDMDSYRTLIGVFKKFAADNESLATIANHAEASIVYSYHDNLARETVAFWLIAMLKDSKVDFDFVDKCIQFISEGRKGGGFGSTQTTSICLQALTKYALAGSSKAVAGNLNVYLDNVLVKTFDLSTNTNDGDKVAYDISDYLKEGRNTMRVEYANVEKPYPYTVNIYWDREMPDSSEECPLLLSAKLSSSTVKRNETVRMSIVLTNTKDKGQPMSMAVIGIPGGLSAQPWQLKELQEREVFDFYEIIDGKLVLYYRELGPNDKRTINLDLKAEIPGVYRGAACSAYLYYSDAYKYWINGLSVTVTE